MRQGKRKKNTNTDTFLNLYTYKPQDDFVAYVYICLVGINSYSHILKRNLKAIGWGLEDIELVYHQALFSVQIQ